MSGLASAISYNKTIIDMTHGNHLETLIYLISHSSSSSGNSDFPNIKYSGYTIALFSNYINYDKNLIITTLDNLNGEIKKDDMNSLKQLVFTYNFKRNLILKSFFCKDVTGIILFYI